GCVRDVDGIIDVGLPVYAAGVCVIGTLKNHSGWYGVPITIGGVTIHPGDYVIGDADGVMVVPAAMGEKAIALASVQHEKEEARDARVRAGESILQVVGLR
ncbi:MAG: RraA family protein, partial [Burkholderiales bacterium]